jgi:hypothetical protein
MASNSNEYEYVKSYRMDQVQEYTEAFYQDGYCVIENVLNADETSKSIDEVITKICFEVFTVFCNLLK